MTRTAILSLLLLAGLAAHSQTATNKPVGVKPDKAYADALISAHGIGTVSFNLPEGALEAMRKVNERNVIEGREIVDGRIVERWRSGHREWATTNLLTPVVGVAMTNTFREVVENVTRRLPNCNRPLSSTCLPRPGRNVRSNVRRSYGQGSNRQSTTPSCRPPRRFYRRSMTQSSRTRRTG